MDANDMKMLGMNLAEVGTDLINRAEAIDVIFSEPLYKPGLEKRDADEVVPVIYEKIKALPSAQPCKQTCKSMYADVSDLVSRAEAIDIVLEYARRVYRYAGTPEDNEMYAYGRGLLLSIERNLKQMPSARSSLITWLLDKIWDEEMWELNWQAFPELLCRKLEKLGYVKRKGDEYERFD